MTPQAVERDLSADDARDALTLAPRRTELESRWDGLRVRLVIPRRDDDDRARTCTPASKDVCCVAKGEGVSVSLSGEQAGETGLSERSLPRPFPRRARDPHRARLPTCTANRLAAA